VTIKDDSRNERFLAAYPTSRSSEQAAAFGVSVHTIKRRARLAGLKKTPAYRSQVQRQNATGRVLSAESRANQRQSQFEQFFTRDVAQQLARDPTLLRGIDRRWAIAAPASIPSGAARKVGRVRRRALGKGD